MILTFTEARILGIEHIVTNQVMETRLKMCGCPDSKAFRSLCIPSDLWKSKSTTLTRKIGVMQLVFSTHKWMRPALNIHTSGVEKWRLIRRSAGGVPYPEIQFCTVVESAPLLLVTVFQEIGDERGILDLAPARAWDGVEPPPRGWEWLSDS